MAAAVQANGHFLTRRALHTAVLNPQGSKQFLKKIVPMAISFILHQRVELDENDFNTRSYGGIQYKVFKPKMRNPTLQHISNWTSGALDALEKNYLRELYLVFESNEDEGKIKESYKFQFKYMGDDVIPLDVQMNTRRDLEEATDCLLTAIGSLNEHESFKQNEVKLKMALTYYEDVTPSDYLPPFYKTEPESEASVLNSLTMQPRDYLHLGILKTGYHTVKCRAKGEAFSLNRSMSSSNITNVDENLDASESVAQIVEIYDDTEEMPQVQKSNETTTITEVTEPNSYAASSEKDISYQTAQYSQVSGGEQFYSTEEVFQCVCNISTKLKHIDTVLCSQCQTFQHCACLGYLKGSDMPNNYVCLQCEKNLNDLTPITKEKQKKICVFRLVVAAAYFTKKVPEDILKMFPQETASFIFKKLIEQQMILEKDGGYKVNLKIIKNKFLHALFCMRKQKRKIPNSMELKDASQANSMVLGGENYGKKRKYK